MTKIMKRKAGRPVGSKNKQEAKKPGKGRPKWSMDVEQENLSIDDRHALAKKTLKEAAFNKLKAPHNPNRTNNGFTTGNTYSTGRPLGSKHKAAYEIEKIGEENSMLSLQQMIDLMKQGNFEATRFLLERVYRIRKGFRRYLDYDGQLKTLEDINQVSEHVMKMAIEGEMSAEEAAEYGKLCEQRLKIIVESAEIQKYAELKALVDNIRDMRSGQRT